MVSIQFVLRICDMYDNRFIIINSSFELLFNKLSKLEILKHINDFL